MIGFTMLYLCLFVVVEWFFLLYFIGFLVQEARAFGSFDWWGIVLSMGVICTTLWDQCWP